MGRILGYVVLLSNLSLVLGIQFYPKLSQGSNYERERQENYTHAIKQYFPRETNGFYNKNALPPGVQHSSNQKKMVSSVGLQAYASNNTPWITRKRNSSDHLRYSDFPRRKVPPTFSQALHPTRTPKSYFHGKPVSQRLSRVYGPPQNRRPENPGRRFHKEGRNFRHHPRFSPKICDPCNSVPWVPLIKVSDSYRKQRTQVTELHPTAEQSIKFDYDEFSSNSHDLLMPSVPLVDPVYDGTISSSFGLPIGNIPTSHGLLAPIATHINTYTADTIDYGSSFNYYTPHGLLETHSFPELSPVPVVPIHDSGQFYQFDSDIPDLVPPPSKPLDVSKVVLTISEDHPTELEPPKPPTPPKPHVTSGKDLNTQSSAKDYEASHSQNKLNNQNNKDFGKIEIIKSVPVAEFTSTTKVSSTDLPLYPPLGTSFPSDFDSGEDYQVPKTSTDHSNYEFLVPPPERAESQISFRVNETEDLTFLKPPPGKLEIQGERDTPKPLTSSSLSWLFSDHTAPPSDSKSAASVTSFSTETEEIASVVNNELRPVSPQPIPDAGNSKSKRIQIIIPYTTNHKTQRDNNALESVQREVFQTPITKPTIENYPPRDFATSTLTDRAHLSEDKKPVDGVENKHETKNQQPEDLESRKYLNEMHHIIASNIRELLREEIEKSQKDQNYPLQNNIDNWTALEYSNHKTVGSKAPKEIIAQALAVTSIPGTSISHLLLPSKKIPNEYFVTTPLPVFDEPTNILYKAENSTVNSKPFTAKPYATTNIYHPTKGLLKVEQRNESPKFGENNHEKNYTEIEKGRVNHWGRLNENLVLPEARARAVEQTTASGWGASLFPSSFSSEKVQIVTPVAITPQRNYTMTPFRRTTREVPTMESPTTPKPTRKRFLLNKLNSTKLEKVSNRTSLNRKNTTTTLLKVNSTKINTTSIPPNVNSTQINTTTTTPKVTLTYTTTTPTPAKVNSTQLDITTTPQTVDPTKINTTVSVKVSVSSVSEIVSPSNVTNDISSQKEQVSINDVFPFRNKELPWEMNLNNSQNVFRIERQRKSLIKQVKVAKSKSPAGSSRSNS